ncbi:MAG: hypothetical protein IJW55_02655 [Clostridia bacterium]|nr:hypothetical protein [Clostridia bacterium]
MKQTLSHFLSVKAIHERFLQSDHLENALNFPSLKPRPRSLPLHKTAKLFNKNKPPDRSRGLLFLFKS